jgi:tetratricopeptide (TPR) repeat protein
LRRSEDYLGLARIQLRRNKRDDALKLATDAVVLAPHMPDAYRVRADIFRAASRRNEAIADYRKAMSLLPGDAERSPVGREIGQALKALNAPVTAQLSQAELDALQARIRRCWSPAANLSPDMQPKLQIQLNLNRDGTFGEPPSVLTPPGGPFGNQIVDAAVEAVTKCQPYRLPAAEYEAWRDVVVTVGP